MNGSLQKQNSSVRQIRSRRKALFALLAATALAVAPVSAAYAFRSDHHDRTASSRNQSSVVSEPYRDKPSAETPPTASSSSQIGTLGQENGGFAPDIWSGLSTDEAITLIGQIPERYDSIVQRRLAQLLLVSAAQPPADARGNKEKFERFTATRIEKLEKMGALTEAAALYGILPDNLKSPELMQKGIEALIYAGAPDAACLETYARAEDETGEFWKKARLACGIYTGQTEAARQSLEKAAASEASAFESLARLALDMEGGKTISVDALRNDSLAWFVWLQSKASRKADLSTLDNRQIASLALSPIVDENRRLQAAILAARKGMIDSQILESVFDSLPLNADDLKNKAAALRKSDDLKATPKNLALLYRTSSVSDEKASKAALIQRGLGLSGPVFGSLAMPYADPLSGLHPEASHISLAFSASFLLYISGFYDNAAQWRALLKNQGGQDKKLLPYVLVAENPSATDAIDLSGWAQALAEQDPTDADRRIKRIISALQPLGYKAGDESENAGEPGAVEEETGKSPSPKALENLKRIAGKGHKAETILLALDALGGTGPDKVDPEVLKPTLDALVSAGLDREARMIALEVVAANIETKLE